MKKKKYWQINTEKLAKETIEIARKANTEEDLKMGMEPLLQKAFKKMGVDIDIVRYEKTSTSFRGRPDAVYGYLTIEYKSPGKLSKKTDAQLAMEQLQRYLGEQAIEFGQKKEDFLEKAIGVATDGEHILFLRFTKVPSILQTPIPVEKVQDVLFPELEARPGFQVLGPYPINKSSISNLLIFVRASARRPLTAENLAAVFAPTCQIAQQTVSELYSMSTKAQRRQVPSRIKTFFQEWDRIFGVVYGQELEKAEKSAEETARLYGMPSGVRLKQLLFAIHTFYAFLMKIISIELVSLQDRSTVKSFVRGLTGMDDDELKPFQSANKTSLFFLRKGEKTVYPVPVIEWKRKPKIGRILPDWSLEEVKANSERKQLEAIPVNPDKLSSSWQTAKTEELTRYSKLKGPNPYKAYRGASTEPYGIFWLRVNEVRPDGIIVIENMHDRGKREIKSVHTSIEPDLVFPAVSGGDIVKYGIKSHFYLLISQDPKKRVPYSEDWMIQNVPLTHAYLRQFKKILLSRGSRVVKELAIKTECYAMYGIGEYTFAKYRVAWKRMAAKMSAVVLSGIKTGFGTKRLVSTDTTAFFCS